jgi:hypothetical protein
MKLSLNGFEGLYNHADISKLWAKKNFKPNSGIFYFYFLNIFFAEKDILFY